MTQPSEPPTRPQLSESDPRYLEVFMAGMQAARMALVKRGWTTDAPMTTADAVSVIDRERSASARILAAEIQTTPDQGVTEMIQVYLFRWWRHWQVDAAWRGRGWLSIGLRWRDGLRPILYVSPDATPERATFSIKGGWCG